MNSIFSFTSTELPYVDQAGSKALALISMTREGLPVPPGFVLTFKFFEPWINTLQTTPEWEAVQNSELEELSQSTKVLQSICAALKFNQLQQREFDKILKSFSESYPGNLFAVRSSSPEEDLEGASFAGGYKTTLGVTVENIKGAICDSFASSFDERVFLYKLKHGFLINQPRMAVIVQQQIDADSAGVAFSLNPLNNCFDEAVINANYGLGESVVAGEVDPDVFVVDKLKHEIIERQIGGKEIVITLNPDGGMTRSSRPVSQGACITPAQVLQLTDLINQVETYYKSPVDIEWAISQEELYLLQVRPVTAYLPLPEEMVTAPGKPKLLYADSTLIEQGVQEPLSVMGTDFVGYVLKVMSGPFGGNVVGIDGISFTAGGRYYMNLSHSVKMMGRNAALAPGSYGDESVMGILDSINLDEYTPEKLPPKLEASKRKMPFKALPIMFTAMKALMRPETFLQNYQEELPGHLQRFESVMDNSLSMVQQATNLTALLIFFFMDYGLPMVVAPQIAQKRIKRIFEEDADRVNEQLLSLGISLPGNKTAEMGVLMFDLASSDVIKTHTSAETFINQLEQRALEPAFLQAWDRFVAEYGARCPREIDVATPRPNEQPGLLFEQLKSMSLAIEVKKGGKSIFEEARIKRETAYHTLYEIALHKGKHKAKALAKYYKTWITLGGHRETGKHYVVKVVDMFRKCALEVARTFVEEGRLDDPEQIFDLRINDIDQAMADATLDLRSLGKERTVFINKIKQSHLVARVIDSRGKIFYPPRKSAAAGELAGVPISPGIVLGKVKVFHSADEKKLLPGEILVARATDPGWTPLFINAGGIILEIGGALQHGALVAREYGLPCVSGLEGATDKLKDGQMVEVDGSNGIVRILEDNAAEG